MLNSCTATRQRPGWQSRVAIVLVAIATAPTVPGSAAESGKKAAEVVQDWPNTAKEAAQAMIDKYGQPDGVADMMLVWENNGPWRRTIVYKDEIQHDFPMPHKDVLEQFIPYSADPQMFDELAEYDGSVTSLRSEPRESCLPAATRKRRTFWPSI